MGFLPSPFRVVWVNLAPVSQVLFPCGHEDVLKRKPSLQAPALTWSCEKQRKTCEASHGIACIQV